MAASLFKKAIAAAEAAPAAPKKGAKLEVEVPGMEMLAQLDAASKAIDGAKAAVVNQINEFTFAKFMEISRADGNRRPDSFRGVEGLASTSVELRKRATSSALTAEQVAALEAAGCPVEESVSREFAFLVNPKYAGNEALLEKVSAALAGIVEEDFFTVQTKAFKKVVGDRTVEAAFKTGREDLVRMVTVQANKPVLATTDIGAVLDSVRNLLAPAE